MMIKKTIAMRGHKGVTAVYAEYARTSSEQNTSRPEATTAFINYIVNLPMNEETAKKLRNAAQDHTYEANVQDGKVPTFIKLSIDLEDGMWEKAMSLFRYAFPKLKGNPQIPFLIRVAGVAYLNDKKSEINLDAEDKNEDFFSLSVEEKLDRIYIMLKEIRNKR